MKSIIELKSIIKKFFESDKISSIFCVSMVMLLCSSLIIYSKRFYDGFQNNKKLSQELASNIIKLSDERKRVAIAKEREDLSQQKIQAEIEKKERYYNDVPLLVSTSDGQGRLVGFSRLAMPNGTAQYSFVVKNSDGVVTKSGTITNQSNKLVYSDDYSTPTGLRTSGEIAHSKPTSRTLRIDFVVTSSSTDKFRIGDTFFAVFTLPGSNVNSV